MNISREEYDRQRRQMIVNDKDDDPELIQLDDGDQDDQDKDSYYGYDYSHEYRRFQPDEQRETVILNHRKSSFILSLSLS